MSNPEAAEKLNEALDEIEEAQRKLTSATALIIDGLDLIGGNEETEPPEEGSYFGGPPGSNGRKVIENKTFQQTDLEDYENTDLLNCTFTKALYDLTLPKNLRLLSCTVKGVKAPDDKSYLFYINNGHAEKQINFIVDGLLMVDCKAKCGFELKTSEVYFMNCVQDASCDIPQTIRQRHGRMGVYRDCKGFKEIAARGWGHYIERCEGASVVLWAGNLPARYEQWGDMHVAGGGNNMQCSELVYVDGVKSVYIGKKGNNSDHPYEALNCIIGPNAGSIQHGLEKGTDYADMDSFLDLWDICGLTPTDQAVKV
jgi:hypothetical protein